MLSLVSRPLFLNISRSTRTCRSYALLSFKVLIYWYVLSSNSHSSWWSLLLFCLLLGNDWDDVFATRFNKTPDPGIWCGNITWEDVSIFFNCQQRTVRHWVPAGPKLLTVMTLWRVHGCGQMFICTLLVSWSLMAQNSCGLHVTLTYKLCPSFLSRSAMQNILIICMEFFWGSHVCLWCRFKVL